MKISSPKKPSTGHAPKIEKTMPIEQLIIIKVNIKVKKPYEDKLAYGFKVASNIIGGVFALFEIFSKGSDLKFIIHEVCYCYFA
jgi:hypothetical protein